MDLQFFIGQVMGTAVGSKVFTEHGWRADAALNLAWTGWTLFVLFLRGPHCPRYKWIGWEGGFELRKSRVREREGAAAGEKTQDDAGGGASPVELVKEVGEKTTRESSPAVDGRSERCQTTGAETV